MKAEYMSNKEPKDKLEDVETVPREQTEKEMHEAVKHVKKEKAGQSGSGAKKSDVDPEEEPVTEETRKQAKHDLQEAIRRIKQEEKNKK
jgi:hypothetical protein